MPIKLYNSLTRQVEEFVPREDKRVNMFVCGPTVYDRVHLGNARTFTVFDVVAKWLRYRGYEVNYIQNITDIDDRIIRRAQEQHTNVLGLAVHYTKAFKEDAAALGITAPKYISVFQSDESKIGQEPPIITEIKRQIGVLLEKGFVYQIPNDGWYFDLSRFPEYGILSGRTSAEANDAISRIDDSEKKRNRGDFCVWKASKPDEPAWSSAELGPGRPGWHIEDTAITEKEFGPQYDIHGGGMDLKFPHHEAEIAQQSAASGLPAREFVKYWMHAGFLENRSAKMSKSLGNFLTLHDALEQYEPAVLRFYLLSNHYRAPLEYNDDSIPRKKAGLDNLATVIQRMQLLHKKDELLNGDALTEKLNSYWQKMEEAMDEDFNTAGAFGFLSGIVSELHQTMDAQRLDRGSYNRAMELFSDIHKIFGIIPADIPENIKERNRLLDEARQRKDFTEADRLREMNTREGYTSATGPYGTIAISASPSPSPSPSPIAESEEND